MSCFHYTRPFTCYHESLQKTECRSWTPPHGSKSPKMLVYAYAEEHSERGGFGGPLPVNSRELKSGKRVYACQTWPAFFRHYVAMGENLRVYYEMTRTELPCKLHFDIEEDMLPRGDTEAFSKCYARVQAFVAWVEEKLAKCWPHLVEDAHQRQEPFSNVIWLDASDVNKPKFSVHLVFNLVGQAMFTNRAHLLAFIHWLSHQAVDEGFPTWTHLPTVDETIQLYKSLTSSSNASTLSEETQSLMQAFDFKRFFLIDLSIYSEGDREFRLVYSHKYKQPERPLRPYDPLRGQVNRAPLSMDDENYFYKTLVSYQPQGVSVCTLLQCSFALGRPQFFQSAPASLFLMRSGTTSSSQGGVGGMDVGILSTSLGSLDYISPSGVRLRRKRTFHEMMSEHDSLSGGGGGDRSLSAPGGSDGPVSPALESFFQTIRSNRNSGDATPRHHYHRHHQHQPTNGHDDDSVMILDDNAVPPLSLTQASSTVPPPSPSPSPSPSPPPPLPVTSPQSDGGAERLLSAKERLARFECFLPHLMDDISNQLPVSNITLRLLCYFPDIGCVTFASNSHTCEIRQGDHRSNFVYYVCLLKSGVFYQRCPDDECFIKYVQGRDWGPAGPPPHLKHGRGPIRMLDPSLWPEASALVTGIDYDHEDGSSRKRARGQVVTGVDFANEAQDSLARLLSSSSTSIVPTTTDDIAGDGGSSGGESEHHQPSMFVFQSNEFLEELLNEVNLTLHDV